VGVFAEERDVESAWNVRCRFFFIPGGDSYVIFIDDWSRIPGNFSCGSVVSQSRNPLCALSVFSSFSRVGSQDVTRCRFFKHSQSPSCAVCFSIWIAMSF